MASSYSVLKELFRKRWEIVISWDFLLFVLLLSMLIGFDDALEPGAGEVAKFAIDRGLTIAALALTVAIANLTFLSGVSKNRLMVAAAKTHALSDFATFSFWEGFVAVTTIVAILLSNILPRPWCFLAFALLVYTITNMLNLLHRLVQIVYRHSDSLAREESETPRGPD